MQALQEAQVKLEVIFEDEKNKLAKYAEKSDRELFYHLVNIDQYLDIVPTARKIVVDALDQVKKWKEEGCSPNSWQEFSFADEDISSKLSTIKQQYEQNQSQLLPELNKKQLAYVLQQMSPLALTDGSWLQKTSSVVNCHTNIGAMLFEIYTYKLGEYRREHNHYVLYHELLQSIPVEVPEFRSTSFITQPHILNISFRLPVLHMAISMFPRTFLPEIIGFTLAHYVGIGKLCKIDITHLQEQNISTHFLERQPYNQENSLAFIEKLIQEYLIENEDKERRVWDGFWLAYLTCQEWIQQVVEEIVQPVEVTPHEKMVALIRKKAPYARGHHRETKIGGKTFGQWFSREDFDPEGFVYALGKSFFVRPKNPEKSLLITKLISFGGPMFRVFTEEEIETIHQWIENLPEQETTAPASEFSSFVRAKTEVKATIEPKISRRFFTKNVRSLYYYLVNVDLFPESTSAARWYADYCLKKTRSVVPLLGGLLKFFPYSHDSFAKRIDDIYEKQIGNYQPFKAPPRFTREGYRWLMHQLAPFILIDGCWLQNIARPGYSHTQICSYLFHTYSDEIGNSDPVLNHPNVYRKALQEENIDLPPFDSWEFAHHKEIKRGSFSFPTYLLAISQFPTTYLPEIIGLNLAIEMDGLGGEYMTFVDELNYWDIDPYIVTLHISIDNMSTGHSAWAMEAVQIYMDQILSQHGHEEMQRQWRRVWTGFLSRRVTNFPLNTSIARHFLKDYILKSVGLRSKFNPAKERKAK